MEKDTKIKLGTWDNLINRVPKVTFEVGIPVTVTFLSEPVESESIHSKGEAYYTMQVNCAGVQTVIQTSAITLLMELSKHAPLTNKTLTITKNTIKGKTIFEVIA